MQAVGKHQDVNQAFLIQRSRQPLARIETALQVIDLGLDVFDLGGFKNNRRRRHRIVQDPGFDDLARRGTAGKMGVGVGLPHIFQGVPAPLRPGKNKYQLSLFRKFFGIPYIPAPRLGPDTLLSFHARIPWKA